MRRRSRYGWLELIEGILLILLGIYTLCNPGGMLRGITFAYGFLAVITGISDIVFYAKTVCMCETKIQADAICTSLYLKKLFRSFCQMMN